MDAAYVNVCGQKNQRTAWRLLLLLVAVHSANDVYLLTHDVWCVQQWHIPAQQINFAKGILFTELMRHPKYFFMIYKHTRTDFKRKHDQKCILYDPRVWVSVSFFSLQALTLTRSHSFIQSQSHGYCVTFIFRVVLVYILLLPWSSSSSSSSTLCCCCCCCIGYIFLVTPLVSARWYNRCRSHCYRKWLRYVICKRMGRMERVMAGCVNAHFLYRIKNK